MILTQSDFARLAQVSRQAISKNIANGILVLTGNGLDMKNDDNALYLEKRGITEIPNEIIQKYQKKSRKKKKAIPPPVRKKSNQQVIVKNRSKKSSEVNGQNSSLPVSPVRRNLQLRKLELEIQEKEVKVANQIFIQKKQRSEVVEWNIADFLFFGYLEKINLDLLRMPKKIEPIVENLVKEGKTREIIRRFEREITTIIREVKKNQVETVQKWREESGTL